ncbi:hypothetical protein BGZ76_008185, partial [Entomortierella beljakovae]
LHHQQQQQQQQQQPRQSHSSPQQPRRQSSFNQQQQQQHHPHHQQQQQQQYPSPQQQQQQQQSQLDPSSQQSNMHFSMVVSPMVVGNLSTPSSPSYPVIKTEEGLQHNLDYHFVYPSFDVHSPSSSQQTHILPSQRSPHGLSSNQPRMISYNQQGQQHQMRLQQQQRVIEQHQYQQYHNSHSQQQNIIYDPTSATPGRSSITSAMSMSMPVSVSIPVTSGSSSSLMANSPTTTSTNFFTSAGTTPMPVFTSTHPKDDGSSGHHKLSTAAMMVNLQSQHKRPSTSQSLPYSISASAGADPDSIHPVSPKRQRQDSGHQQNLALVQMSPTAIDSTIPDFSAPQNTIATADLSAGATMVISTSTVKRPRRSSTSSSRTSTGSGFDPSSDYRANKVPRTSVSPSMPIHNSDALDMFEKPTVQTRTSTRVNRGSAISAPHVLSHHTFAAPQSHSQLQLSQPVEYTHVHSHTHMQPHAYPRSGSVGNVTHPRRAAQNRNAQRTFRNRRKAYIKDMEQKVLEINQTRSKFDMIHNENREIWGRYRALETLIIQNGLSMPSFPPMTPFFETDAGIAAANASAANALAAGSSGTGASNTLNTSAISGHASTDSQQIHHHQGSESEKGEDETDLLSHQHNLVYKTENDSDIGGEPSIDGGRVSPQQRQQQQQQRMDAHVQELDIRRS